MKKIFAVIMIISLLGHVYAQDFHDLPDMLRFSLHHYMQNPPCPKYRTYFWKPGDPYFVSVSVPDSCIFRQVFPREEFSDVRFCESGTIPAAMTCRVKQRRLARKRIPNMLHNITYSYSEGNYQIRITSIAIILRGKQIDKYIGLVREYYYIYDNDYGKWRLDNYGDFGP